MALANYDIIYRKPAVQNDTAANGGSMTAAIIGSAVKNALWPDTRIAERSAGSDKWRKLYLHFAPVDNSQALDVHVIPWSPTAADDRVRLYLGTHSDTQATIAATPGNAYGAANANVAILAAGSTSVAVALESAAETIFRVGGLIHITDKESELSADGAEEYATLTGVSVSGTTATLSFAALANAYAETPTAKIKVASVLDLGDVIATVTAGTVTSTAGTFDAASVVLVPRSAINDTWMLTFTSATAYSVSGTATGALATAGSTTSSFSPTNNAFGGPYFAIPPGAFSGTFAAGDTLTFFTAPAARGLWERRITPAGAGTYSTNSFSLVVDCESA